MDNLLPIEELLYEGEGATLDFKSAQYKFLGADDFQKSELLKDVLAFSNAWRRTDAFILIGVNEVKGGRSTPVGIEEELDDAQLQQFVNEKTQRPIDFHYSTVLVDGVKIGVIRIAAQTRPFYLKKDYGKLKKNVVYIRRGSSTGEAAPDEVRDMGRAEIEATQEVVDLDFCFADLKSRSLLNGNLTWDAVFLKIPPKGSIIDFEDRAPIGMFATVNLRSANRDYYRELVNYYHFSKKSNKLAFALKNGSSRTISDIRVEFIVRKNGEKFGFIKSTRFPTLPKSHFDPLTDIVPLRDQLAQANRRRLKMEDLGDRFHIEIPFEKVQPMQTVFCDDVIYMYANDTCFLNVEVTIYADNIPVPIEKRLEIGCNVTMEEGDLGRIASLHKNFLQERLSGDPA